MTKFFYGLFIVLLTTPGHAQLQGQTGWFKNSFLILDSVYSQVKYEEPGVMTEEGGIGGIRGEFGFNLYSSVYLSFGGSYFDGGLHYDGATFGGAPVQTNTLDIFRDLRVLLHFAFSQGALSVGLAERSWHNDLVISYRRLTEYKYVPVRLTMFNGPYYYTLEYDSWQEGLNTSYMSDVGGGRNDVRLRQNKGSGYGLEFGRIIGGAPLGARVFLSYHKWDVEASEPAFDGVDTLIEPKNNTQTFLVGVGLFY